MTSFRKTASEVVELGELNEPLRSMRARLDSLVQLLRPYPLHRNEPIEPFFVVGSGRCGTTLLRRLLQASPEVHIPPENWALGSCIHLFRRYRRFMPWRDMVHLLLGRHVHGSRRWFDEPPFDLRSRLLKIPSGEQSLARLLDEMYRYHGRLQGATFKRWGDKTPRNVGFMNEILSVFPRAKFIHMMRDGLDVIYSCSKMSQYAGDIMQPARRWKNSVSQARTFASAHPGHFLEVRYEHLVQRPEETVERICWFINLDYSRDMLNRRDHYDELQKAKSVSHYENAFHSISTDSIGKGRRNLSFNQKRQVATLIEDDLERLGYEPL